MEVYSYNYLYANTCNFIYERKEKERGIANKTVEDIKWKKGQRSNEIKTQQTQDDSYLNTICYLVIPRIDTGLSLKVKDYQSEFFKKSKCGL